MALLQVEDIGKSFGATKVLENISFDLQKGEALAIIGSSGSGKTTLLRCLNFLETADTGRIIMMAKEYAAKGLIWPLFSTAVFFLIFVGALTLLFDRLEKRLEYFR